jgi:hypothetical protein
MLLATLALVVHLLSCAADRVLALDPMRGINDPAEAQRRKQLREWGLLT